MYPYLEIEDQLGHTIVLPQTPQRVVSLVPSITYTLYKLGLDQQVAGITRFCKWPAHWKKQKRVVGGTKDFKPERIAALQPDLILANKEENTKDLVLALQSLAPVYVSDVVDMATNNQFIADLGRIFNRIPSAEKLNDEITIQHQMLQAGLGARPLKAAYMIWKNPWMSIGGDTFINYMMAQAGLDNVFNSQKRYPTLSLDMLKTINPEVILLSSEPYPFKEQDKSYLQEIFPDTCILLVQGEAFTWFGAYPAQAFSYIFQLLKQLNQCIQNKKN